MAILLFKRKAVSCVFVLVVLDCDRF